MKGRRARPFRLHLLVVFPSLSSCLPRSLGVREGLPDRAAEGSVVRPLGRTHGVALPRSSRRDPRLPWSDPGRAHGPWSDHGPTHEREYGDDPRAGVFGGPRLAASPSRRDPRGPTVAACRGGRGDVGGEGGVAGVPLRRRRRGRGGVVGSCGFGGARRFGRRIGRSHDPSPRDPRLPWSDPGRAHGPWSDHGPTHEREYGDDPRAGVFGGPRFAARPKRGGPTGTHGRGLPRGEEPRTRGRGDVGGEGGVVGVAGVPLRRRCCRGEGGWALVGCEGATIRPRGTHGCRGPTRGGPRSTVGPRADPRAGVRGRPTGGRFRGPTVGRFPKRAGPTGTHGRSLPRGCGAMWVGRGVSRGCRCGGVVVAGEGGVVGVLWLWWGAKVRPEDREEPRSVPAGPTVAVVRPGEGPRSMVGPRADPRAGVRGRPTGGRFRGPTVGRFPKQAGPTGTHGRGLPRGGPPLFFLEDLGGCRGWVEGCGGSVARAWRVLREGWRKAPHTLSLSRLGEGVRRMPHPRDPPAMPLPLADARGMSGIEGEWRRSADPPPGRTHGRPLGRGGRTHGNPRTTKKVDPFLEASRGATPTPPPGPLWCHAGGPMDGARPGSPQPKKKKRGRPSWASPSRKGGPTRPFANHQVVGGPTVGDFRGQSPWEDPRSGLFLPATTKSREDPRSRIFRRVVGGPTVGPFLPATTKSWEDPRGPTVASLAGAGGPTVEDFSTESWEDPRSGLFFCRKSWEDPRSRIFRKVVGGPTVGPFLPATTKSWEDPRSRMFSAKSWEDPRGPTVVGLAVAGGPTVEDFSAESWEDPRSGPFFLLQVVGGPTVEDPSAGKVVGGPTVQRFFFSPRILWRLLRCSAGRARVWESEESSQPHRVWSEAVAPHADTPRHE